MAVNGRNGKNKEKPNKKKPSYGGDEDILKDDTASFEPREIHGADQYELDENWEPWDPDQDGSLLQEYDSQETGEETVDSETVAPKRNDVVLCQNCGEDYSKTYHRCPFCDERMQNRKPKKRNDPYGPGGMDPRHFVGFAISMVLIFTAGFIVVQEVLPLLLGQPSSTVEGDSQKDQGDTTNNGDSTQSGLDFPDSGLQENPDDQGAVVPEGQEGQEGQDLPGDVTEGQELPGDVTDDLAPVPDVADGLDDNLDFTSTIALSHSDVSLKGDESFTLTATGGGQVTWTSSHPEIASVSSAGVVTNLNTAGSTKMIEIYGTVNGATGTCVVRCATGTGGSSSSSSTASGTTSSATGLGTGSATIANAPSGVRIRSGAGTSYDVLATGSEGSAIEVISEAGGGWYQIRFTGASGKEIGYLMGDFIKMN